jgi:hypothetical protein
MVTNEGEIVARFKKLDPYLKPRAPRDCTRIFPLAYGHALLNGFQRERVDENTIRANGEDIDLAFQLYEPIQQSNESWISPESFAFKKDGLVTASEQRRPQRGSAVWSILR